jgi:hypothetical protein
MEGPSVASCQVTGEWTQLQICRGKSNLLKKGVDHDPWISLSLSLACKSIKYCRVHSCIDGVSSLCIEYKQYTKKGYQVAINHNRKKYRGQHLPI